MKNLCSVIGVLCASMLSLPLPLSAQEPTTLDILAKATLAKADAPGIALMSFSGEGAPSIGVAGVRVVGSDARITADDLWHWGSVTKSMTATLVARMVELEAVQWDDTIGGLLGELAPDMLESYRSVTFRHLLVHRSGLAANIPMTRFREFGQDPRDPIADRARWVRLALSQASASAPGESFLYSNNGFIVAGAMLEAATGVPWEELMQHEVFEPLNIHGAGFGPPAGKAPTDQPRGHTRGDGGSKDDQPVPLGSDNPAALGPAGRVHMSMTDMSRYLAAHLQRPSEFLSTASWEMLHTAHFKGNYAMGWSLPNADSRSHNGSNTMWYAEVAFDRASGKVAAVAVNDGDMGTVRAVVGAALSELLR